MKKAKLKSHQPDRKARKAGEKYWREIGDKVQLRNSGKTGVVTKVVGLPRFEVTVKLTDAGTVVRSLWDIIPRG